MENFENIKIIINNWPIGLGEESWLKYIIYFTLIVRKFLYSQQLFDKFYYFLRKITDIQDGNYYFGDSNRYSGHLCKNLRPKEANRINCQALLRSN